MHTEPQNGSKNMPFETVFRPKTAHKSLNRHFESRCPSISYDFTFKTSRTKMISHDFLALQHFRSIAACRLFILGLQETTRMRIHFKSL